MPPPLNNVGLNRLEYTIIQLFSPFPFPYRFLSPPADDGSIGWTAGLRSEAILPSMLKSGTREGGSLFVGLFRRPACFSYVFHHPLLGYQDSFHFVRARGKMKWSSLQIEHTAWGRQ
jgi:hypothetical protein